MDLNELIDEAEESCSEEWGAYAVTVQLPNGEVLNAESVTFDPDEAGKLVLHCDFGSRYIRKAGESDGQ
jgi:hypothetical protein